jgi:heme/copper-type cytochrome/quinol oxidase subunit 2
MKMNKQCLLIMLGVVALFAISGCTDKSTGNFSGQPHNPETQSAINMSMNATMITKEAVMKNNFQEVDLKIKADGYSPDVIIAKKGVLLKINVTSDSDAGCATEIVFPDFNITRTVPAGKTDVIEIMPSREGTFNYRCAMDMYRGKLIITK